MQVVFRAGLTVPEDCKKKPIILALPNLMHTVTVISYSNQRLYMYMLLYTISHNQTVHII